MIRMEVASLLVLLILAYMYFSAKRECTKLDTCFSEMLILSIVNLLLDGVTVYTVNHLEIVPIPVNDTLHRLFYATVLVEVYFTYRYMVLLVEEEAKQRIVGSKLCIPILVVGLIFLTFLPINYVQTKDGNYSYGPAVFATFLFICGYLISNIVILCRHWSQVHKKKRVAVTMGLTVECVGVIFQALFPLALSSGMSIMLVNLSFFLTIENPDIFLIRQIREQKRKAEEANAAKSIFLSHMSHEIRTPMNAIVGMTDILLRTELTEEQKEYLLNIKSSGQALVSIINDILDLSKIEAGKMELVENVYDFRQMIQDIRIIVLNRIGSKRIDLLYEVDEKIPNKLYGDGIRIRQVIINLMNNAVKFTENGYVKLSVKKVSEQDGEIRIFMSISDTGQGIRKEDLKKLFKAFAQVDLKKNQGKEGTGLGLAISSQLVGMMGGNLEVNSEYGKGSEFYFTISQKLVTAEREEHQQKEETLREFIAPEAKILIVDDNAMNLKVAVGLLTPFEMQIDTAESGKKALDMIQKKEYHIVFMDHMMPGMDGVETTRRIRALEGDYYKELPIIALTADAMTESQKLFAEASMNGFVAKPIEMVQMVRVLLRWLPKELICEKADSTKSGEVGKNIVKLESGHALHADIYHLDGIDAKVGIQYSGSEEFFISLLGDFYKLIDAKAGKIEKCLADGMIKDYTIEVHALKSTSRMLGATELSKRFEHLEQLGHAEKLKEIQEETPEVLALYRSYKDILKSFGTIQEGEKKEVPKEEIILYLQGMQEAAEASDLDTIDDIMERLERCRLPEECILRLEQLRVAVADVALEEIFTISKEIEKIL